MIESGVNDPAEGRRNFRLLELAASGRDEWIRVMTDIGQ